MAISRVCCPANLTATRCASDQDVASRRFARDASDELTTIRSFASLASRKIVTISRFPVLRNAAFHIIYDYRLLQVHTSTNSPAKSGKLLEYQCRAVSVTQGNAPDCAQCKHFHFRESPVSLKYMKQNARGPSINCIENMRRARFLDGSVSDFSGILGVFGSSDNARAKQ